MTPSPTRIAVVDDDASVRKALARLLSASAFDIETYGSAREFLKSLKAGAPDCLVVDLHMPELTGFDLQRRPRPRRHQDSDDRHHRLQRARPARALPARPAPRRSCPSRSTGRALLGAIHSATAR